MSCVWDSIRDAISNDYSTCKNWTDRIVFHERLKSSHLPNFIVINNKRVTDVIVNGEKLSDQFINECKQAIDTLKNYPIYTGYLCSTCEPLFIILCSIFKIGIKHTHYNGETTVYKWYGGSDTPIRKWYFFQSTKTHIWCLRK